MKSHSESYKKAGVDVTAGYEAVRLMKSSVENTFTKGVLTGIGGFGGLFELDTEKFNHPVLVSGTDGVGTKLKLAILMDKHDTVGQDCVAMCVNDIVCSGAEPLVFLDYIAVGKNYPENVASIVRGVADGCVKAGCALVGGETAEMPGMYKESDYDLAGFAVGAVEKSEILDGSRVSAGDKLIALPSSGVHSNGFSLVRRVFDIDNNPEVLKQYTEDLGAPLGEVLLAPTKIYVKPVLAAMKKVGINAVCHITGGGFYENIPRMLPKGLSASINTDDINIPLIFELIARVGDINARDMFNTFNMGVGMMLAVSADKADAAVSVLRENGEEAYIAGGVVESDEGVILW
ncbi:MAG: phosphoribosylformylglycinamidine cyclo-ligase [Bacillota bacterium]|nr:phosphoribosylformylglycinamidine cyclo-ligase [Bacillota bacterium]